MSKEKLAVRKRKAFFCSRWVFVALLGLVVSCSHANVRQAEEGFLPDAGSVSAETSEGAISPQSSSLPGKRYTKSAPEEMEAELNRLQQENSSLKAENEGLRNEILKLQASLADATQNIYALNRKLDAIFKPDETGE